jgi:hypothetical protein
MPGVRLHFWSCLSGTLITCNLRWQVRSEHTLQMAVQMADAKAAAGIVSVVIAAAVFLIGFYWRWEQRRRDREALLATLEQQYSEKARGWAAYHSFVRIRLYSLSSSDEIQPVRQCPCNLLISSVIALSDDPCFSQSLITIVVLVQVQPACAYVSALTRKIPGAQLWSVLLAGAPPELQRGPQVAAAIPAAATAAAAPHAHSAGNKPQALQLQMPVSSLSLSRQQPSSHHRGHLAGSECGDGSMNGGQLDYVQYCQV